MKELYKEDGEMAGFWDICEWWIESNPKDIFINEPKLVIEIRDRCEELLKIRKDKKCKNKLTKN